MKVIFQDDKVTDRVGAAVIISMLSGALSKFVCPKCFCLVANRDGHREAMHPVP